METFRGQRSYLFLPSLGAQGVIDVYCTKPQEDVSHLCSTYHDTPRAWHILGAP